MILNIQEFLDEINSNVNYCHWKSNMGLAEALVGKSDFDFLIDEACRSNFEFIATKYGFIETNTVEERSLNGAQDWIGFCSISNSIIHIHAHYELWIGAKACKSFKVPFVKQILEKRRFQQLENMWCSSYEHEFILIVLRILLRQSYIQRRNAFDAVSRSQFEEFSWLQEKQSPKRIRKELANCGLMEFEGVFLQGDKVISHRQLTEQLSFRALRSFSHWQELSPLAAELLRIVNLLKIKSKSKLSRIGSIGSMFFNTHRSLNGDGIVISIVGIDGSGKSTTVNACHEAISKKIDCVKVYFGKGTSGGAFSKFTYFVCIALSTIFPFWQRHIHGIRILLLRFLSLQQILQASKRGKIVLVDRWIQTSDPISDGPIFYFLQGYLKKLEHRLNDKIDTIHNLLVILDIPVNLALKRKNGNSVVLKRKYTVLRSATFLGTCRPTKRIPISEETMTEEVVSDVFDVLNVVVRS